MTNFSSVVDYQKETMYGRAGTFGPGMDWSNQPELYKRYPGAEAVELPRELVLPKVEAWRLLRGGDTRSEAAPDLTNLASLLFMASGFTSQMEYSGNLFLYRSAPSAGALYPIDVYVAARDISGLDDGLYHFSVIDFALTRLRKGPVPADLPSPAIVLSSRFFRSAWKYRDRAYRYCLLDGGHLAENLMLSAQCLGLSMGLDIDFDDDRMNGYLGLDGRTESALMVLPLGSEAPRGLSPVGEATGDAPASEPAAKNEIIFDRIVDMARLTAAPLRSAPDVPAWPEGSWKDLSEPAWESGAGPTFVNVQRERRSRRNFRPKTVRLSDLARVLRMMAVPGAPRTLSTGFVTNEVQDIADGFYYTASPDRIMVHKGGFIAPSVAQAALQQEWVGRANFIFVLSAPLAELEAACGPKAYRSAYITAGRVGQRAYLAAEALGWGCCGVGAFFDGEVQSILSLPPAEFPMYILPLGPVKKRTHGGRPTTKG